MRAFSLRFTTVVNRILLLAAVTLVFAGAALAQAQASSADLNGTVTDPSGAFVPGATVTARDTATGVTRSVTSDESGEYKFIGLPPSEYEITAEAKTFKKTVISPVRLTVGQNAELTIRLEVGAPDTTVTITGEDVELVETTRTTVSTTIDQQRIENLPINERSATGFALTISTVGRDNGRPIGPAPTSGLNIGGQRGRSTLVQVDGSDFTDNSINAARSTVSQEAVQEFQVATNSYAPEFGRATGGIINVVTKRGGNEFTGNVFGFIRDKSIQARNPFAPFKSAFTRTQYGATLGGPIVKDRSFFFASFERRQRNESGFFTSDVTNNLTSSVTFGGQTFGRLTPDQAARAQQLIATNNPALVQAAVSYLYLASGGGSTALTGINPLFAPPCTNPPTSFCNPNPNAPFQIGSRFFLTGAPIPLATVNANGEPIAFRPLLGLQRVFPITDRTNYFSVRGDHF
ncbi:MAG TPA: TonB-dependent receptor, partial [Pyrinomonadaceae bacterium]